MNKIVIVILTVLVETGLLWGISFIFGWVLIDILFLGGLAIFGIIWMTKFSSNQAKTVVNSQVRGWNGLKIEDEGVDIFNFHISSVVLGVIIFLVLSFIITVVYYWSYFF